MVTNILIFMILGLTVPSVQTIRSLPPLGWSLTLIWFVFDSHSEAILSYGSILTNSHSISAHISCISGMQIVRPCVVATSSQLCSLHVVNLSSTYFESICPKYIYENCKKRMEQNKWYCS